MNYDKDMFGTIIQSYEQLKQRAEEVFNIREKHIPQDGTIDNIDIGEDWIEITTSSYCCGEHENFYYSFPSSYLLKTDDELEQLFAQERIRLDEEEKRKKEKQREAEQARTEAFEREQLKKLLEKYGDPR